MSMEGLNDFFSAFSERLGGLTQAAGFSQIYTAVMRYVFPLLALLIVIRCIKSLLSFHQEPEIWAWLCLPHGPRQTVTL